MFALSAASSRTSVTAAALCRLFHAILADRMLEIIQKRSGEHYRHTRKLSARTPKPNAEHQFCYKGLLALTHNEPSGGLSLPTSSLLHLAS